MRFLVNGKTKAVVALAMAAAMLLSMASGAFARVISGDPLEVEVNISAGDKTIGNGHSVVLVAGQGTGGELGSTYVYDFTAKRLTAGREIPGYRLVVAVTRDGEVDSSLSMSAGIDGPPAKEMELRGDGEYQTELLNWAAGEENDEKAMRFSVRLTKPGKYNFAVTIEQDDNDEDGANELAFNKNSPGWSTLAAQPDPVDRIQADFALLLDGSLKTWENVQFVTVELFDASMSLVQWKEATRYFFEQLGSQGNASTSFVSGGDFDDWYWLHSGDAVLDTTQDYTVRITVVGMDGTSYSIQETVPAKAGS